MPSAQEYGAAAAAHSDESAAVSPVYTFVKHIQDPSTYTAAADAAKKSDEDAKKSQASPTP